MNKISAVIITLNEEQNIGRCLEALSEIVDEIVVVDSFSTDQTENICQKYGVRFVKRAFTDYADTKNFGMELAENEIILSVDADEVLSEELRRSILEVKKSFIADGYYLKRKTNYCGRWIKYCGWYPDKKLRLWRKSAGKWQGKVHETVYLPTGNFMTLEGDLLHYSFNHLSDHARSINRYTEIAAHELFEQGKNVSYAKIIFSPCVEFFKKYLFQRGFLEGFYGFVISVMSSYYKFYKYAKLKDLWIRKEQGGDSK